MANGQQLAQANLESFTAWAASKQDDHFRELLILDKLSRVQISKQCGFSRSVFSSNPRVKEALESLETELRERGILPSLARREMGKLREKPKVKCNTERVSSSQLIQLSEENANLRAENDELKETFRRYEVLEEALMLSGRLRR